MFLYQFQFKGNYGTFVYVFTGCDSKLRGQKSRPNILRQRVVRHAERARILPDLRFDFTAITVKIAQQPNNILALFQGA
jgi:hypothetical protein